MSSKSTQLVAFTLLIGARSFPVESLAEAGQRYQKLRGLKSSRSMAGARVIDNASGQITATVSYNGRVWSAKPWASGDQPLIEADGREFSAVVAGAAGGIRAVAAHLEGCFIPDDQRVRVETEIGMLRGLADLLAAGDVNRAQLSYMAMAENLRSVAECLIDVQLVMRGF